MSEGDRPETELSAAVLGDIESTADLFAYAEAMEHEAAARYRELADQMQVHNNAEVAELFAKLADIESLHAGRLAERNPASARRRAPWEYRWLEPESPESTPLDQIHYRMTPHHALKLALHNEERARVFYALIAEHAEAEEVRALAGTLAAEEAHHVELVRDLLARTPEPPADWNHDFDPPQPQG